MSADPNSIQAQLDALQRRRDLAQSLSEQGMQPQQNQVVNGRIMDQGFAPLIRGITSILATGRANSMGDQIAKLTQQKNQAVTDRQNNALSMLSGSPQQPPSAPEQAQPWSPPMKPPEPAQQGAMPQEQQAAPQPFGETLRRANAALQAGINPEMIKAYLEQSKPKPPIHVAAGDTALIDPSTMQTLWQGKEKAPNKTSLQNDYEYAKAQGFNGSIIDYQKTISGLKHSSLLSAGLGLSEQQNEALFGDAGAVTTGKLDPSKLNSRTAKIMADAYLKNPTINMNRLSADASLQRNAAFQQKSMTLDTIPEVLNNMVDLGKKIGFSDNRTVGKMQAWAKGEFNDPVYTEYMGLRNDGLMSIAGAMRGVGMTDMAHKAEVEASSPTLSPAALDGWLRGQMKSLAPRLERYQRVNNLGNTEQPTDLMSAAQAEMKRRGLK